MEKAKIIAEATGRTIADVLDDLGDDGILNESNKSEKDLITQLKEAAELISTVQQINNEVAENSVLNGGDNKTEVTVETTLEGDIVDRAIESVNRKVQNIKKIVLVVLPIFLILTGGTLEGMGLVNMLGDDESPPTKEYNNDYGGCLNPDADNYTPEASWDDGSCHWEEHKEEQCIGDLSAVESKAEIYDGNNIEVHMTIANNNQCDTEIELMISFYYENGYQFSLENNDFPTYWIIGGETTLTIRHDSFNNLGDGNYSLETRFFPMGQSEECCIMTDSVWVDTEPEPEPSCNGTASFYAVMYEWENETNDTINLRVTWDADWSCDEVQEIEIDLQLLDNNSSAIYTNTFNYGTDGIAADNRYLLITNISKPTDGFKLGMNIWVNVNGWRNDASWSEEL